MNLPLVGAGFPFNHRVLLFLVLPVVLSVAGCDLLSSESSSPSKKGWEPTAGPYGGEIVDVGVAPNGTVYAVTYGYGLYRRPPRAPRWSRISFKDNFFHSVFVDSEGTVFVANDRRGLLYSKDGGKNWTGLGSGLENTSASREGCLLYDPYTGAHRRVNALTKTPDGQYLAATDCGLYRHSASLEGEWRYVGLRKYSLLSVVISSNGTIFAGGDATPLFISRDDGQTWSREGFEGSVSSSRISGLAIDEEGRLYVALDRLYVSEDEGHSWQIVASSFEAFSFQEVAIGPEGRIYASSINGLFYSDDGRSWAAARGFPDTGTHRKRTGIDDLAIRPDGGVISNVAYIGLMHSNGDPDSWALYNRGIQGVHLRRVTSAPDGTLYATALQPDLVYRSTDGGETWSIVHELTGDSIYELFVDGGGTVYAASTYRVYRSTDQGASWTEFDPQAGHLEYGIGRGFTQWGLVFAAGTQGTLLAGADDLYQSEDGGKTWARVSSYRGPTPTDIAPASNGGFYVMAGEGRVYRSDTMAGEWTELTSISFKEAFSGYPKRISVFPSGGGLLVSSSDGLYRLSSDGEWRRIGLKGRALRSARAVDDHTFIAATYSEGIGKETFLTRDAGQSWTNVSEGLTPNDPLDVYDLAIGPQKTVYAATRGGGVFRGIGPLRP